MVSPKLQIGWSPRESNTLNQKSIPVQRRKSLCHLAGRSQTARLELFCSRPQGSLPRTAGRLELSRPSQYRGPLWSTAGNQGLEASSVPRQRNTLRRSGPKIQDRGPKAPACQAELRLWPSYNHVSVYVKLVVHDAWQKRTTPPACLRSQLRS